jgi:FKBP-type peptidyl-prolyl cis-trans isomerase FklB
MLQRVNPLVTRNLQNSEPTDSPVGALNRRVLGLLRQPHPDKKSIFAKNFNMKNILIASFIIMAMVASVSAQDNSKGKKGKTSDKDPATSTEIQSPQNATDSLSYSFGLLIGNNMLVQGVKDINWVQFLAGFNDGYAGKAPVMTEEIANKCVQDYFDNQISDEKNMNLKASEEFLAANATKEGVVTLPSGLQYKIIEEGSGDSPQKTDQVRVHYHGTFVDGKVFDSSIERNEPIVFGVDQVIPGWTEALLLMKPGAKWMLYIPSSLAYGEQGAGGVIGPNQALIFEVQLIEIVK